LGTALVIDTSLNACSVGLFEGKHQLFGMSDAMTRGQSERLAMLSVEAFDVTGIKPKDLTHIGVTLGPGSFTGLRIGLSFAKGLAAGVGIQLKGISTLEALAGHADLQDKSRMAVVGGGRGQIYVQRFAGIQTFAPEILDQNDEAALAVFASAHPTDILTGPAAALIHGYWPQAEILAQEWPALKTLARLTLSDTAYDDLTPLYMREADAIASTRGIITLEGAAL
jgi:tRNA threonylcarbamoyladenosine biosynthesis protein TsaB